jgi:hypothetical protein
MLVASGSLLGCSSVLQGASGTVSGGSSVPYEHATGPEDVLVSVDFAGWYSPLEYSLPSSRPTK